MSGEYAGPWAGDIHGVATLAMLAAAGVIVWRFHAKPGWRRMAVAGGAAALAAVGLATWTAHGCDAGTPDLYTLYLFGSAWGVLALVPRKLAAAVVAIALAAGWTALSVSYVGLVHERDYTGNPSGAKFRISPAGIAHRITRDELLATIREEARTSNGVVPPGDLLEALPPLLLGSTDTVEAHIVLTLATRGSRELAVAQWYTPITGLWRVDEVRWAATTRGGKLSEIADRIDLTETRRPAGGER